MRPLCRQCHAHEIYVYTSGLCCLCFSAEFPVDGLDHTLRRRPPVAFCPAPGCGRKVALPGDACWQHADRPAPDRKDTDARRDAAWVRVQEAP